MATATAPLPDRTIGIDLGDRDSKYCVVDLEGAVIEEGRVHMDRESVLRAFPAERPARMVIEASGHSRWVARCLGELGHEVIVANPRHVQMISKNERKSDRNDARLLARIGRLDPALIRPVTQRSERSSEVRALLSARRQLVATRTRLINLVRAEIKVAGGRVPSCWTECFHKRARPYVPESLRPALEPVLGLLEQLQEHLRAYDKAVARLCKEEFPATEALRQVCGVGPVLALTYVVTIDDPARFSCSRTVGAYLGLIPRSYQSGDSNPQLSITKAGDGDLRRLLVSSAAYILRKSSPACDLKRFGQHIARSGSSRDRGRARVAVARKLAALLHRLWTSGEVYDPMHGAKRVA